jgi:tetratricopeptide (TPR) repeat protein
LADCDRSLQLDVASANAHDSRGFVLYRLNRFGAAIADFSKSIVLNAKLASAWYGRGLAKLRIKDLTAARDIARAKAIEPGIAERFAAYGIRPHANGPSGA